MRKITVLAALAMLLALAVPAMAESPVTFNGYLRVYHADLVNFTRADNGDAQDSDNFFANKFQLTVDIKPTEDVSVRWVMRTVYPARWGEYGAGVGGGTTATGVYTRSLHAMVRQPWGTLYIGRIADNLPSNVGGLYSLGYRRAWGEFAYTSNIFDLSAPVDAVAYDKTFDNGFGFAAYYAKDAIGSPIPLNAATQKKDEDKDEFGVEPRYKWDTGGVALGIAYVRDMRGANVDKDYAIFINPAFTQAWGPFSLSFEGKIGWGKRSFDTPAAPDAKTAGLGLFLDANYDYGSGDVSLVAFYADGTSVDDNKTHNLVDLGDFSPFLVAMGVKKGLGLGTWGGSGNNGSFGMIGYQRGAPGPLVGNPNYVGSINPGGNRTPDAPLVNLWGIGLLGHQSITDGIRLNYGVGTFRMVNAFQGQSKNLGFEVDLGATFNLIDNLSFDSQFGYLWNGDAYKVGLDIDDPKGTYAWINTLIVTF
jgi:hypothetical protein